MLGFDVFYPTSIASLTTWRRLTKAPAKEFCLKKNMEKMNISSPMKASNAQNIRKNHVRLGFLLWKKSWCLACDSFFNKKWMLRLILPNLWPGVVFIGVAKNGDGIFNRPSFCSPWEVVGTPNGWWWRWMDLQHLEAAELNPESRIRRKSSKAPNLHWFWIWKNPDEELGDWRCHSLWNRGVFVSVRLWKMDLFGPPLFEMIPNFTRLPKDNWLVCLHAAFCDLSYALINFMPSFHHRMFDICETIHFQFWPRFQFQDKNAGW